MAQGHDAFVLATIYMQMEVKRNGIYSLSEILFFSVCDPNVWADTNDIARIALLSTRR